MYHPKTTDPYERIAAMAFPTDLTDPCTYPTLPALDFFAKRGTEGGDDEDDDDSFDTDGGAGGDDEDDEDDDDEGDEDEDEKEPTIEELKASNARMARALKKANSQAKKYRLAADKPGSKKSKDDDEDEDEKLTAAEERGLERGRAMAKRSAVEASLLRSGLVLGGDTDEDEDRALSRALRLIDLDDLEVDDNGKVTGVSDAIAELKDDMPQLFKRSRSKRNINGTDDKAGKGRGPKKLSASEEQAEQLAPGSITGKRR